MAIAPNVDRKHRHFTGDINGRCNVHKNDGIIPLDSQYSLVRCGPAPQSTAGCLEHRNGSISAATTWNGVIEVALASLRGLLSRENWVYWFLTVFMCNYITMYPTKLLLHHWAQLVFALNSIIILWCHYCCQNRLCGSYVARHGTRLLLEMNGYLNVHLPTWIAALQTLAK